MEERSDSAPSHSGFPTLTPSPLSVRDFADPYGTCFCFPCVLCVFSVTLFIFTCCLFQDQLNLELRRKCVGRSGSLSCLTQAFLDIRVFLNDGASFEEVPIRLHFVDYSGSATRRDEQSCMETE